MENKNFMKEVTSLFSNEKIDELNGFLQQNKVEAIANKKIISELNKQLGGPLIMDTIIKLEKDQKEEYRGFLKSVERAVNGGDEALLFTLIKQLDYDERFSNYRLKNIISDNPKLYEAFIQDIIDNRDKLNINNKEVLRGFCLWNDSLTREKFGEYYCNSTNDIEDKIQFLKLSPSLSVNGRNNDDEQREKIVNQLFDLLTINNKEDTNTYFSKNLNQYIYLNKTNSEMLEGKSFSDLAIVSDIFWDKKSLKYFLSKIEGERKIEVPFNLYCKFIGEVDVNKFIINRDEQISNKDLLVKFNYDLSFLVKL